MESKFYDGTKLLSLLDINGDKPEIYICTGNRSAGKTTYFGRLCVKRFLDKGEKFGIIYRFTYELDNCAEKFFKDIGKLFFPEWEMKAEKRGKGAYAELYLNGASCGYAVSLNQADQIKKYSHMLSDISRLLFDEFQSETNHYCPDELRKFISIHVSLARGNGEQSKYLPVYMLSNAVSVLNPYFVELGITERLNKDTKFMRGTGFVLEQCYLDSAASAQKGSAFNRAFESNKYVAYSAENVYLNDNSAFIEKPSGTSHYVCTLRYEGADYAIREFYDSGIAYCDTTPDMTHPVKISVTTDDHKINYIMLKKNDYVLTNLRFLFERGCFRFKNLKCKEAVLKALSYKV